MPPQGGFVLIQKALFFSLALLLHLLEQANLALQLPVQGILLADDGRPLRVRGRRGSHARRPRILHVLVQEEFVFLRHIGDLFRQPRPEQGLGIRESLVVGLHPRQLEVVVEEPRAPQGGLDAIQGAQKFLHVEREIILLQHLHQDVQDGKHLLEFTRGIEADAQALFAHLGLQGVADLSAHLRELLAPLQIVLLQVAHLHGHLRPVQAGLLPDEQGDVLDQDLLEGVGGLPRLHQAV